MQMTTTPNLIQFATLGMTVVIGICTVYLVIQSRGGQSQQQRKLVQVMSGAEDFLKLQREFFLFLRRVESDSHELQKIALQIQSAVAALNEGISAATIGAAERQASITESLRTHMEMQEQRLVLIAETITDRIRALPLAREAHQSRLRRETLRHDASLRFSVLQEWLSINTLAIRHRAARPGSTANDLIATIPADLEPTAEILNDSVLLVGTRGYPERVSIQFREDTPAPPPTKETAAHAHS
jgi:hypothetical protein